MAARPVGKVERLLALPYSTLRHWEHEVGLLSPRRNSYGRRRYSDYDIRLLLRLRHLALRKALGLSAAREKLMSELSGDGGVGPEKRERAELRARVEEVRGDLVALWFAADEAAERLDSACAQGNRR
ncbi:MAG: MerR family transcriptional regulator [Spirochaetaceae bacterium]|nr:MerR family transcriptional regulator [Spirochaetaceae bacterium]